MKISLLILSLITISCGSKHTNRELKLAHGLDVNHSVHKAMELMSDRLEHHSGGKMTMRIYPNQQLGSERELLELLQIGSIDLSKASAAVVENFAPEIKLLSIPYLFRSDDHMAKVFDGPIGDALLASSSPYLFRGLSFYDAGKRSFYTKDRRVDKPEDLKGLKIRVQSSNTAIQMVNNFGAAATPIPFGELYTALQQGVVDGAENNPPSFYLTGHYEVCKYYILDEHTGVPDMLLISEHTWKKLNEEERGWLQQSARESYAYQKELWKKSEEEALEAVRVAGVEIIRPDKRLFQEESKAILGDLLDSERLKQLYHQVQDVK